MIFDPLHTRDILNRQAQGPTFVLCLDNSKNVNNTILHDDLLAEQMRPASPLELAEKPASNGAVVNGRRFSIMGGRQSLQQVAASHDADELALVDHRHALDTMPIQDLCNLSNRRRESHRDNGWSHDVRRDAAVGLDVVTRESVRIIQEGT